MHSTFNMNKIGLVYYRKRIANCRRRLKELQSRLFDCDSVEEAEKLREECQLVLADIKRSKAARQVYEKKLEENYEHTA